MENKKNTIILTWLLVSISLLIVIGLFVLGYTLVTEVLSDLI